MIIVNGCSHCSPFLSACGVMPRDDTVDAIGMLPPVPSPAAPPAAVLHAAPGATAAGCRRGATARGGKNAFDLPIRLVPSSFVRPVLGVHVEFPTDLRAKRSSGGTCVCSTRTHWVTTTYFMRFLPIPRLRAYLGVTKMPFVFPIRDST